MSVRTATAPATPGRSGAAGLLEVPGTEGRRGPHPISTSLDKTSVAEQPVVRPLPRLT
jgi:hypothetical protein